jgi:hypothetical protein
MGGKSIAKQDDRFAEDLGEERELRSASGDVPSPSANLGNIEMALVA